MDSNRVDSLKKILEKDPNDSFSKYALGLEYLSASMLDESRGLFENIIEIEPDYLAVYYQLGKVYELMGETEKAGNTLRLGITVADAQNDFHTRSELEQAIDEL